MPQAIAATSANGVRPFLQIKSSQIGSDPILYFSLMGLLAAMLVRGPLGRVITGAVDRLLFRKSSDYQRILKEAARGMARVQHLDRLFKLIVYLVSMRIRVSHVSLFYFDKKSLSYALRIKRGRFKGQIGFKIDTLSPLAEWLKGKKEIIVKREIDKLVRKKKKFLDPKERKFTRILPMLKEELNELDASLCVPCFSKEKLLGFLVLGKKLSGDVYTKRDINLLSMLSHEVAIAVENALLYEELASKIKEVESLYEKEKKIFLSTALAFATAIDAKDPYTHGHTERVTKFCLMIKEELERFGHKFDKDFEKKLQVAALLHDVGKIGTPDQILNKKGPLTRQEYEEIKKHSLVGAAILQPIEELRDVSLAIKHHQERWDGLGYPDGLKGDQIPLISRILMVADAFDALVSNRPYRQGVFEALALEEIQKHAGTQFDPMIADVFIRAYRTRGDSATETVERTA